MAYPPFPATEKRRQMAHDTVKHPQPWHTRLTSNLFLAWVFVGPVLIAGLVIWAVTR